MPPSLFTAATLIGWTQPEISTPEEGLVEVCASVIIGSVDQRETVTFSYNDISTRMYGEDHLHFNTY